MLSNAVISNPCDFEPQTSCSNEKEDSEAVTTLDLVESVRLNPENSDAADRLAQKLTVVDGYLSQDANAICSGNGNLSDSSRKAVALIEARALWDKYGSGDHCTESVRNDLVDGWGVSSIKCILERNSAIRYGNGAMRGNSKSCPRRSEFLDPVATIGAEGK